MEAGIPSRQAAGTEGVVPSEVLPCPGCHALATVRGSRGVGIEEVRCEHCSRLLRRRPALSVEQRAQELVLRWAAAQLEGRMTTQHRRKARGDDREAIDGGLYIAVTALRDWARTIHKRPPLRDG